MAKPILLIRGTLKNHEATEFVENTAKMFNHEYHVLFFYETGLKKLSTTVIGENNPILSRETKELLRRLKTVNLEALEKFISEQESIETLPTENLE